jgi:hypothetical protein
MLRHIAPLRISQHHNTLGCGLFGWVFELAATEYLRRIWVLTG